MAVSTTTFEIMKPFKYWCQKVLPAVYDDSLSYYELLAKVVDYLNNVAVLTNTQSDAITELQETLAEFMAGDFDPYIEEKVDEWFAEHEPEITEELARLKENMDYSQIYGGDGTLIFEIEELNENLFMYATSNHVSRDKASNVLRFDIAVRNQSENNIPSHTQLFKLKNFYMRYNQIRLNLHAIIYIFTDDSDVSDVATRTLKSETPARIFLEKDGNDAIVTCDYYVNPNRELVISGETPTVNISSWICSSYYNPSLANSICAYFLNGDGDESWEGTFEYSQNNDYRLDPQYLKTDCSGMVYIAYDHFGFYPQNGVVNAYLNDGRFVTYAAKGEKLDLTNAKPGDIICFQEVGNDEHPEYDYSSWRHCSLYTGNNVCYEMSLHYPEAETREGCVDGYGPYRITTPADEYRMNDELNSLTGQLIPGRNRCVVRFL